AQFASQLAADVELSPRSMVILTYALLGFANFSSIAIQIGGIGGLAPERRSEIARYGLRAMIAGNLAAFTSASIAGMLV
ncbi:MAG TPA: nucleoside transporter C-terminal domain-containing protein, partial [Gemmatimonadales bacterium]